MTQQFPLFLAAKQQQELGKQRPTITAGNPASMGVAAAQLPHTQAMATPFSHQDLMAWLVAGSKMGGLQLPSEASTRHHLALDAAGLASELNAARCCSPDHVVPQQHAPASPVSPLEDWQQAAAPAGEGLQTPATPELLPREPAMATPLKRKRFDYEHAAIAPRTSHRRKSLHPMRAAEAVAEDWELRASPARSSTPPVMRAKHDARSRHSPERIHRKVAAVKSRPATPTTGSAGSATKECHDCHTLKTPMWRRVEGTTYCNACGLRRTRALVGR